MTESNGNKKRVTCKRPLPNQHFHELLESLYQDAVKTKSKVVPALKEALLSLEKYPLPLSSGSECAILKGFDRRLCKYIDLHINGQISRNKKTKVHEHENSIEEKSGSRPLQNLKEKYNSKMPRKNKKKNKHLITNTEKCTFASNFGEASSTNTADSVTPSTNPTLNNHDSASKYEKNNNITSHCPDDVCTGAEAFDTYFVNRSRQDADNILGFPFMENMENNCLNDANFALCENWESYTTDDCQQFKTKYDTEIRKCFQPIQVDDSSDDNDTDNESVTDKDSVSDVEIAENQPQEQDLQKCQHKEEVPSCKTCESITTAADAFQLYYKDKMKREIAEIKKCILPRKMYKPAYRSGAYAILVALLEQRNECPYRDCLTKDELIQKARKHTDQSFTTPKPESNYTAWTNVNRLITKGMIEITNEHRGEDFYTLTAMGRAVAMELVKEHTPKVTINDVIFHGQRNDRVPSLEDVILTPPPLLASVDEDQSSVFIEMPPGTFDIVMLIDKRENFDKNIPASPNNYCKYESRSLTIGDFLWVARSKKTGQELVLPYIVERKRMDDLASSIKDGRFHEQKFRLRKCGLKNVLYLVESYNNNRSHHGLPFPTLMQAVVNTNIQEEFNVIKTDSIDHTFKFLGMLSERLVHEFLPIFLRGCNRDTQGRELMTFEFFYKYSCKNKPLTVKDTFIKMLLQLKGLSVEKALAIANKYSTPRLLMKAYERCTVREGELLLANLKFNKFTRNVGPSVSKTVYQLFSRLDM